MSTSVQPAYYHFTVADYHRMLETGVLNEDSRVELLNGRIIEMSPIGKRHTAKVKRLNKLLGRKLDPSLLIGIQDPIQLDDYSEPQPDISVLKPQDDFYESHHPLPADVLFLIEVADSSVMVDREVKLPAYALAGVAEVWLVDLTKDRIEVHSKPHNGIYQEVHIVQRGQAIISTSLPQLELKADDILG
ncbi:MAG: Uma2 family endonuclease [Acidobacteria bacterium]|nr:Uma2 family endonuclease [Acidobacteriota bacterium]MBI3424654.1 Uma2 family endonuclease [Acidobacteriota bacterium]